MRVLLARHGETDWNAVGRIQGQSDTVLNDNGRLQADQLAQKLKTCGIQVERIYSSPQKRAAETAERVGVCLNQKAELVKELREISFGIWEGHSWEEIGVRWAEEYAQYERDRMHVAPSKGECYRTMLERVLPALYSIVKGKESTVLVVAHSAVIKGVLCWLDGCNFADINRTYPLANASWVELDSEQLLEKCEIWERENGRNTDGDQD